MLCLLCAMIQTRIRILCDKCDVVFYNSNYHTVIIDGTKRELCFSCWDIVDDFFKLYFYDNVKNEVTKDRALFVEKFSKAP